MITVLGLIDSSRPVFISKTMIPTILSFFVTKETGSWFPRRTTPYLIHCSSRTWKVSRLSESPEVTNLGFECPFTGFTSGKPFASR